MTQLDPIALEAAKLLPCPFCGGNNVKTSGSMSWTYVWCSDCSVRGPAVYHGGPTNERATLNRCEAEAIAAWNRRPTPLARQAALEEAAKEWLAARNAVALEPVADARISPSFDQAMRRLGSAEMGLSAAIRSLIASPGDGTGWQPEEAAPRDGTYVIVTVIPFDTPEPIVSAAYYRNGAHDDTDNGWWWAGESPGDYYAERIRGNVIAWQPMPEAAPLPAPDVRGDQ